MCKNIIFNFLAAQSQEPLGKAQNNFLNIYQIRPVRNRCKLIPVIVDQQEMLVHILKNRIIESRRDEIASDAAASIAEFQADKLKVQTASEAIQELREYLNK
ncbi:hypothetical protein [Nostoc sp.]|uniref:hypothetical protein n=1 Tax=Nostoc sp. TaxID=1180 RepID=UPI002FF6F602